MQNIRTGSGDLSSIPLNGYWGSSTGLMRPEREVNSSSSSSADVKNEWSYKTTILIAHGAHRGNFSLPRGKCFIWGVMDRQ